jgi:hypothetical protein
VVIEVFAYDESKPMDANQLLYTYVAGLAGVFALAVFGLLMGIKIEERIATPRRRTDSDELRYRRTSVAPDNYLS